MFRKIKQKIFRLNIFRKFFLIQIFALFIIIAFVCVPFGIYTSYVVVNEVNKATASSMLQLESSVKALCRECAVKIDSVFASLYNNSYLSTQRTLDPNNVSDYLEFFRFRKQLENMNIIQNNNEAVVRIYTNNPNLIYDDNHINPITDEVKAQKWYKDVNKSSQNLFITTDYMYNNEEAVTFIKNVNHGDEKYSYYIVMSVLPSVFYNEIRDYRYNVYLALRDGNVISDNDENDIENLSERIRIDFSDITKTVRTFRENGNVIMINSLENNGIMNGILVCQVLERDVIMQELRNVILMMLAALIILCTVCIIIVYNILKHMVKRFIALKNAMVDMEKNNFTYSHYSAPEVSDEISLIERQFVRMSDAISELLNKVYKAEIENSRLKAENAEANINALQSQINPHFLFNVMESIRMKNIEKGDEETADIISQFAHLIRNSVDWNNTPLITLRSEIETVDAYLKIQSYRLNNRFTYSIDIDEAILDCDIPRYTIQPIVENCVCHGIEHISRQTHIEVVAKISDDYYEITVTDNGIGMDEETLSGVRTLENVRSLKNIHKRLMYYYGEEYSKIYINSEYNKGTEIKIRFPF